MWYIVSMAGLINNIDGEVGDTIKALDRIFPGYSIGSRRRALKKDIKAYKEDRLWLDKLGLPEEDKKLAIIRLQRDLLHADNLKQIVQDAAPQIRKATDVKDLDPDWVDNFAEKAGKISDEDMQRLWSKLLAGEVNDHGTFAKKTVNTLYELDKDTAKAFSKYCTYALKRLYPKHTDTFYNHHLALSHRYTPSRKKVTIIPTKQIKSLADAGLITQVYKEVLPIPPKTKIEGFSDQTNIIMFENSIEKGYRFVLSYFPFTRVGDQLCRLCEWGTAPDIENIIRSLPHPDGILVDLIPRKDTSIVSAN